MAKTLTLRLAAFIALVISVCACRDLPKIGDLAGQWQVTRIEYTDGTTVENPLKYYCFYREVANLTGAGSLTAEIIYNKPELTLIFPKTAPEKLTPWGIPTADTETTAEGTTRVNFHIARLTSSALVLTLPSVTITMRKY